MNTSDDQPVTPAVEETPTPVVAPKPRKVRKLADLRAKAKPKKVKAKANGKPKAKAAPKAAPKGKVKARAPRHRDPAKLDQFGYRKGSIRSKAAALYARKRGATLAEVKELVGSVQFNLLTEQRDRGNKISNTKEVRNNRTVKRYFLKLKAAA
jgi:hypothetical protein